MLRGSSRLVALLWIALTAHFAGAQETAPDPARTFITQIAPDLAIVTEVSLGAPFVGQQFSLIYRLRALRPPAAVDVDPQQFRGFWTEIVPLSPESASAARPVGGQAAVDYLLRQVIAFPLLDGALRLPPLSVKVKRPGSPAAQRDDWDVLGSSSPVDVRSVPLPPWPRAGSDLPLVGSVAGSLKWQGDGRSALLLEMEGTANLALFRPVDWLGTPQGARLQARLAAADNVTQTIDKEGKRQLSLIQRQRWLIGISGGIPGQRIGDFRLPVFDPREKTWKEVRVEGVSLPGSGTAARGALSASEAGARAETASYHWQAVLVVALVAVPVVWFWVHRRHLHAGKQPDDGLDVIEKRLKTSPRSFLDSAHRLLERRAAQMRRSHNLGAEDTALDRCWITVQRYRFNREPLSPEARNEILKALRELGSPAKLDV